VCVYLCVCVVVCRRISVRALRFRCAGGEGGCVTPAGVVTPDEGSSVDDANGGVIGAAHGHCRPACVA